MENTETGKAVRTTCPYCGVGCGVIATPDGNGGATIAGDTEHPANFGRLCSKGSALGETLALETRLLHPEIDGQRVTWDAALDHVSSRISDIKEEHGPGSIAFYLSGQLLTEDYYVANKLAKGFIGTPHVDTNSRLCMSSSVAGHKRAFGADIVPQCYDDLELADLIVLVGSNAAWCHPILYQRIQVARAERGVRVVVIDPRRTATCEGADLHLPIEPGKDSVLWNGLLVHLADKGLVDWRFIGDHTEGFPEALAEARGQAGSIASIAIETGLNGIDIETFFSWWSEAPKVVSCYSQGVNQSARGTDKVNAIINCHLATGRIGKIGSGPLSLTGQPNAMGGREVGGLANMLAAHMGFSPADRSRVSRFWQAPNLITDEGLKAVQMFDAIADGRIKALWVMGTNPAVSLPQADYVRAALCKLELFVVSENVVSNDTAAEAGVRLPAAAWGEKDGTVTNSERRISRQRKFLPLAGEARPDWWILSEVAKRLGYERYFAFESVSDIFREHASLSHFENGGTRPFDLGVLTDLSPASYDQLAPVQWPISQPGASRTERLFGEGGFATPNGRARFVTVRMPKLAAEVNEAWPFVLNTGRVRDQWHTMTRTGLSPRLWSHISEPFVEVHPSDAETMGLVQGQLAEVETASGKAVLRTLINGGQAPGSIFAPIHWSGQNSSAGRIGALVHPFTDPVSGQPEAKATPARISPLGVAYYGVVLSRVVPQIDDLAYWARSATSFGWTTHIALREGPTDWGAWSKTFMPDGEQVSFEDPSSNLFRVATLNSGRLEAVAYFASKPELPSLAWLASIFERTDLTANDRRSVLAGRPIEGLADEGDIICVCFQVGAHRIREAIRSGCNSVEDIGCALRAGTNCGSCVPELRRLLSDATSVSLDAAE
ncbi:nitrate reductase [Filomicrobium sp.]|uniref:nitrate reductase n=1 Tax=Filomicrobium sp. TaxID=2024831 RepID=UPI00258E310F|nr:nitrate reductase [Filomicrobium sp.]MCV0368073.1 molybdopterin-dependent oxidoreductase [Filomicrobium sp.]